MVSFVPWGEYWSKSQVVAGKAKARAQGFKRFKVTRGSYIGSYTLHVA